MTDDVVDSSNDGNQGSAGEEEHQQKGKRKREERYVPPDTYEYGPIPGVEPEVMACFPPNGMVHEYVWWASQCTYASPIWHVASILPVLAYEACKQRWDLPARKKQIAIQSFLIGRSTSAKSTCLRMARAFHEDFLMRTMPRGWDLSKNGPWIEAEGTPAGLLEALHDRYDPELALTPAILFHEEVDGLLSLRDPTMPRTLMRLFDASPRVERQLAKYRAMAKEGRTPPNIVEMPAISGVFASTVSSMTGVMTSRHFEGGLVSRALWLMADPDLDKLEDITDTDRWEARSFIIERWTHYAHHLFGLRARGDKPSFHDPTKEVKELLEHELQTRFRAAWSEHNDALAAQLQRALMQTKVIMSLYALSRGALAPTLDDARAALNLVSWSTDSVDKLSGLTDDRENWRLRKKALDAIIKAEDGGLDRTQLYKLLKLSKGELDALLASMIDEGCIIECKVASGGRGRPRLVYKTPTMARKTGKLIEFKRPDAE